MWGFTVLIEVIISINMKKLEIFYQIHGKADSLKKI